MQKSGTESHNSFGIGVVYPESCAKPSLSCAKDHTDLKMGVILAISVKKINDTFGPEGIIPSSIVFGEFLFIRALTVRKILRKTLAERTIAT